MKTLELFGNERIEWFKTFLELPNGIPDKDTFCRVFECVDHQELSKWLNHRIGSEREPGGHLISVDGKTIRRSGNAEHNAYHVVNAWVGEQGLTPGQKHLFSINYHFKNRNI